MVCSVAGSGEIVVIPEGKCGDGSDFCGVGKCQSGTCLTSEGGQPEFWDVVNKYTGYTGGTSPDGTCGGENGDTCDASFGRCCGKDGKCGRRTASCGEGW